MKPGCIGIEEMTEDNIITVDIEGDKVSGEWPRHNEVYIHSEVMRARPDINCVIHTHPEHAIAFSSLGKPLPPMSNDGTMFSAGVPIFSETTDLIIDQPRGKAVAKTLGQGSVADPAQPRHRHRRPHHRACGVPGDQARDAPAASRCWPRTPAGPKLFVKEEELAAKRAPHQPRRLAGQRLQLSGAALAPALRLRGAEGVSGRRSRTSTAAATRAADRGRVDRRELSVSDRRRAPARGDDARGEARPAQHDRRRRCRRTAASEMERQIARRRGSAACSTSTAREQPQRVAADRAARAGCSIPLIFGLDVLHGHRTIFPIPLAEAGAFDPGAVGAHRPRCRPRKRPRRHHADLRADARRLPRPALGPHRGMPGRGSLWWRAAIAEAKVRGYQGADLAAPGASPRPPSTIGAYGAVRGRAATTARSTCRSGCCAEVYLPPFEAAVKAGVAAIMPAFNDVAGMPMTAHGDLLNDLAARTTGASTASMVSDYTAVAELIGARRRRRPRRRPRRWR